MDSSRTNTPMGTNAFQPSAWDDMFTSQYVDDSMPVDESFGNSAFNDFTNFTNYAAESPLGLSLRTPSKSDQGVHVAANPGSQLPHTAQFAPSAESSSQDSASDSSSRRKRKTNDSESPVSDPATEVGKREVQVKQEDVQMAMGEIHQVRSFDNNFAQPMHNLSLEQRMSQGDASMSQFAFNSAASSPIQARDFNSAMSLDAHMNNMQAAAGAAQYTQDSPVQTINPGMFTIGASRDQSPATNNMMFNQQTSASPHAIFSTPSSDSPETYSNNQNWTQNPTWPNDYNPQLASPGAMAYTPSPGANGATPGNSRAAPTRPGRSRLHIAPISTKSRVETQINVIMTLERPPPGVEHLHLPLHTIAKSKLLTKEEYHRHTILELHTMLVCSSAMHNPQLKEKALQRAAAANNEAIQARAEQARDSDLGDEEKNDPKSVPDEDKPANGGEVRICSNCIQRERKRAGRKKTKREEEQQHWERFETERVVVFNSNEYLQFKPCEPGPQPQKDDGEPYIPPDGAMQATAAMRIACYCRHQSEKEGFQVIFTMKDQHGNVVAQQMSDSILITDDHKTHPQSFSAAVSSDGFYPTTFLPNGLPMSQSMIDMSSHVPTFSASRSVGNLQAMAAYPQQFNPHSHVHQVPNPGYASQTTSATMTPTTLSRPGSPTNAGNTGPNKKRKSASFHRKVPSGLTMTPRVDTSQPPSSNLPSASSMNSQFSPNFPSMNQQPYMTMPANAGPAHFFNTSGPPTPSESSSGFNLNQSQVDMSRMNNQAYFSHPSSAVPSRASSPVLTQARGNMAAYARQPQPIQTPTNSLPGRQNMFATGQIQPAPPAGNDVPRGALPVITRVTPADGPAAGGNEIAVLGENFVPGISVAFGDQISATQFLSPNSLVVTAPPGRPGVVYLNLFPPGSPHAPPGRYPDSPNNRTVYTYNAAQEDMMVMALKYLSEQQFGNPDGWQNFAKQSATNFLQSRVGRAGLPQQGYGGG